MEKAIQVKNLYEDLLLWVEAQLAELQILTLNLIDLGVSLALALKGSGSRKHKVLIKV